MSLSAINCIGVSLVLTFIASTETARHFLDLTVNNGTCSPLNAVTITQGDELLVEFKGDAREYISCVDTSGQSFNFRCSDHSKCELYFGQIFNETGMKWICTLPENIKCVFDIRVLDFVAVSVNNMKLKYETVKNEYNATHLRTAKYLYRENELVNVVFSKLTGGIMMEYHCPKRNLYMRSERNTRSKNYTFRSLMDATRENSYLDKIYTRLGMLETVIYRTYFHRKPFLSEEHFIIKVNNTQLIPTPLHRDVANLENVYQYFYVPTEILYLECRGNPAINKSNDVSNFTEIIETYELLTTRNCSDSVTGKYVEVKVSSEPNARVTGLSLRNIVYQHTDEIDQILAWVYHYEYEEGEHLNLRCVSKNGILSWNVQGQEVPGNTVNMGNTIRYNNLPEMIMTTSHDGTNITCKTRSDHNSDFKFLVIIKLYLKSGTTTNGPEVQLSSQLEIIGGCAAFLILLVLVIVSFVYWYRRHKNIKITENPYHEISWSVDIPQFPDQWTSSNDSNNCYLDQDYRTVSAMARNSLYNADDKDPSKMSNQNEEPGVLSEGSKKSLHVARDTYENVLGGDRYSNTKFRDDYALPHHQNYDDKTDNDTVYAYAAPH